MAVPHPLTPPTPFRFRENGQNDGRKMITKFQLNNFQFRLNTFPEFISSNTHTFRELLLNKSKHIFRIVIKHYRHFQPVTPKQYYTFFQSLHQPILLFSEESYLQTILHTFPDFLSNNTDIFRELMVNSIAYISRAYIKQY